MAHNAIMLAASAGFGLIGFAWGKGTTERALETATHQALDEAEIVAIDLQKQIATLTSERDSLVSEMTKLKFELAAAKKAVAEGSAATKLELEKVQAQKNIAQGKAEAQKAELKRVQGELSKALGELRAAKAVKVPAASVTTSPIIANTIGADVEAKKSKRKSFLFGNN